MLTKRHVAWLLAFALAPGACAGSPAAGDTDDDGLPGPGDGDGDGDGDGETSTDELNPPDDAGGFECESPWDPAWIGSACDHDQVCDYEEGFCLVEEEGFPCGTCTQPCTGLCPDLEDAPVTFCVESGDLLLPPGEGLCLSQCDPALLGGNGCRDDYECIALPRFGEPGTNKAVCVPEAIAPEPTDCLAELDALGLTYAPADIEPEHPDTHPELTCLIDQPVYLYGPIDGVEVRYFESESESPILVSCPLALSVARTAALLDEMGAVEILHMGTYNCRVISGTNSLSEHAFANAIDLYGFTRADDSLVTIYDHWEDNVPNPATEAGQWLLSFADTLDAEDIYNIILTPNHNADHDDHIHADLTPGADFYE